MSAAPPSRLIWMDPGGQTGFAWLFDGIFGAFEHPFYQACRALEAACEEYGPLSWRRNWRQPAEIPCRVCTPHDNDEGE
jgi:hypothetical protein